jgi:hypothetical protein
MKRTRINGHEVNDDNDTNHNDNNTVIPQPHEEHKDVHMDTNGTSLSSTPSGTSTVMIAGVGKPSITRVLSMSNDPVVIAAMTARDAFQQQLTTLCAIGLVRQSNVETQQSALKILMEEHPELMLRMLATAIPSIPLASQTLIARRLAPFVPVVVAKDRLPDVLHTIWPTHTHR